MDVPNRNEPNGGLTQECANCGEPATGEHAGHAYCTPHLFYERGYADGRADQARETLWTVVQGVSHGFRGPIGERMVGDLSPADVRADVERILKGE